MTEAGGTVNSSHINSVLWIDDRLTIVFNDGSIYAYPDVSRIEFERLYEARSVGSYFYNNIKGKYKYVRLE